MRILKTLKKEYTEMTKVRSLFSVFMVLVIFCFAKESFSQTDVLTGKQSDAQYVYTARDTSTIPDWVYGSVREGIITNEGTVKMEVFFSDRSGVLDSAKVKKVELFKCKPVGGVEVQFNKKNEKVYPVTFKAYADPDASVSGSPGKITYEGKGTPV